MPSNRAIALGFVPADEVPPGAAAVETFVAATDAPKHDGTTETTKMTRVCMPSNRAIALGFVPADEVVPPGAAAVEMSVAATDAPNNNNNPVETAISCIHNEVEDDNSKQTRDNKKSSLPLPPSPEPLQKTIPILVAETTTAESDTTANTEKNVAFTRTPKAKTVASTTKRAVTKKQQQLSNKMTAKTTRSKKRKSNHPKPNEDDSKTVAKERPNKKRKTQSNKATTKRTSAATITTSKKKTLKEAALSKLADSNTPNAVGERNKLIKEASLFLSSSSFGENLLPSDDNKKTKTLPGIKQKTQQLQPQSSVLIHQHRATVKQQQRRQLQHCTNITPQQKRLATVGKSKATATTGRKKIKSSTAVRSVLECLSAPPPIATTSTKKTFATGKGTTTKSGQPVSKLMERQRRLREEKLLEKQQQASSTKKLRRDSSNTKNGSECCDGFAVDHYPNKDQDDDSHRKAPQKKRKAHGSDDKDDTGGGRGSDETRGKQTSRGRRNSAFGSVANSAEKKNPFELDDDNIERRQKKRKTSCRDKGIPGGSKKKSGKGREKINAESTVHHVADDDTSTRIPGAVCNDNKHDGATKKSQKQHRKVRSDDIVAAKVQNAAGSSHAREPTSISKVALSNSHAINTQNELPPKRGKSPPSNKGVPSPLRPKVTKDNTARKPQLGEGKREHFKKKQNDSPTIGGKPCSEKWVSTGPRGATEAVYVTTNRHTQDAWGGEHATMKSTAQNKNVRSVEAVEESSPSAAPADHLAANDKLERSRRKTPKAAMAAARSEPLAQVEANVVDAKARSGLQESIRTKKRSDVDPISSPCQDAVHIIGANDRLDNASRPSRISDEVNESQTNDNNKGNVALKPLEAALKGQDYEDKSNNTKNTVVGFLEEEGADVAKSQSTPNKEKIPEQIDANEDNAVGVSTFFSGGDEEFDLEFLESPEWATIESGVALVSVPVVGAGTSTTDHLGGGELSLPSAQHNPPCVKPTATPPGVASPEHPDGVVAEKKDGGGLSLRPAQRESPYPNPISNPPAEANPEDPVRDAAKNNVKPKRKYRRKSSTANVKDNDGKNAEPPRLKGRKPRTGGSHTKNRCGSCLGCSAIQNCGKCIPCLGMEEFGGTSKILRFCILRRCLNPTGGRRKRAADVARSAADSPSGSSPASIGSTTMKAKTANTTAISNQTTTDNSNNKPATSSNSTFRALTTIGAMAATDGNDSGIESLSDNCDSVADDMSDLEWDENCQANKNVPDYLNALHQARRVAMPPYE